MARHASGWKLRLSSRSKTYSIRFWSQAEQRQVELSTGEQDPQAAAARAPILYADYCQGKLKDRAVKTSTPADTEQAVIGWIEASRGLIADNTLDIYAQYFRSHLVKAFPSLLDVTPLKVKQYITERLQLVKAQSVRKELSALRGVLAWAEETKLISEAPHVPGVPKKVQGTPFEGGNKRRAKAERLEPEEVEAFLDALPIKVSKLGFVRPRFILQYEMGLRPSLVDRLEAPKHWYPGSNYLNLDAGSMKAREESMGKLLTKRAKQALEASYKKPGLIYGHHDYRLVVKEIAKKTLKEKAGRFTTAHLRSAQLTHMADSGASLSAIQSMADHKLPSTTDRYIRSSKKALEQELRRQGRV